MGGLLPRGSDRGAEYTPVTHPAAVAGFNDSFPLTNVTSAFPDDPHFYCPNRLCHLPLDLGVAV